MTIPDVALMQAALVGGPHDEIVALEARLRAAQLAADVDALDALISRDLLFTGPDGQLGSKEADLAAYRLGVVRFRSHEPEELRVRHIGDVAAMSALRARLSVEVGSVTVRGTYRYTRILGAGGGRELACVGWARERRNRGHVAIGCRMRYRMSDKGR